MSSPVSTTVKLSFFLHNCDLFNFQRPREEKSPQEIQEEQQNFLKLIFQQNKHVLNITLQKTIDGSRFEVIIGQLHVQTLASFFKNHIQLPYETAAQYSHLNDAVVNMSGASTREHADYDFRYYYKLSKNEKFVDFVNTTEIDILFIEN